MNRIDHSAAIVQNKKTATWLPTAERRSKPQKTGPAVGAGPREAQWLAALETYLAQPSPFHARGARRVALDQPQFNEVCQLASAAPRAHLSNDLLEAGFFVRVRLVPHRAAIRRVASVVVVVATFDVMFLFANFTTTAARAAESGKLDMFHIPSLLGLARQDEVIASIAKAGDCDRQPGRQDRERAARNVPGARADDRKRRFVCSICERVVQEVGRDARHREDDHRESESAARAAERVQEQEESVRQDVQQTVDGPRELQDRDAR